MRKCVVLAALMAVSFPTIVAAQTLPSGSSQTQPSTQQTFPEPAKWFVHLHGGGQAGSRDISRSTTFTLYDEPAEFGSGQTIKGGGLLDIGGAARLYEDYGLGVSYTRLRSAGEATFNGSLPHPLEFDRPRSFSGAAPVEHTEEAVHIQALWFIPYTDKIDFTVGIGPSFFKAKQGFVRGITFSENPPDFTSVTIDSVDAVDVKESGVGFNIGGTMTYAVWKNIGASAMLRYTRGSLTFPLSEGQSVKVNVGGFQFGAGVGVRFAGGLGWPWW